MKKALVCGGAGFIGHHLAKSLKAKGYYVVVSDIKSDNEYVRYHTYCNKYIQGDLRQESTWEQINTEEGPIDEVYQLAADMGGAGFVFTGEHDADIMLNSAQINIHCIKFACKWEAKVLYTSSACMYPAYNQEDPLNPKCSEDSAYPANPDSEYGWEKLFSERLYLSAARNYGLDVRIARLHNIFGPEGTYDGGREKAPAAMCRKALQATDVMEVWGPGTQTRSFLYIDECIEAFHRLFASDYKQPINIGSEEMIAINDLAKMAINFTGKNIQLKNVPGPVGVMGRNSDNKLIREVLGWEPTSKLVDGMSKTFDWIKTQIE